MGMAQAQTQTQEQIMDMFEEMTEDEIKTIIRDVLKNPEKYQEERKFILVLTEDIRPGNAFTRYNKFEVLYGDVKEIELSHIYDYPYTDATKYALLPLSRLVIVLEQSYDETQDTIEEHEWLHVFTSQKGWVTIKLY